MATLTIAAAPAQHGLRRPAFRPEVERVTLRRPRMALTEALLDVAARGISFATPGHRCGRSVTPEP